MKMVLRQFYSLTLEYRSILISLVSTQQPLEFEISVIKIYLDFGI